jgi:hypothetical protein
VCPENAKNSEKIKRDHKSTQQTKSNIIAVSVPILQYQGSISTGIFTTSNCVNQEKDFYLSPHILITGTETGNGTVS